ncbi:MAG: TonB-dependent receptor [Aquabacterium sp.]
MSFRPSIEVVSSSSARARPHTPHRLSPIAALLATVGMLASGPSHAQAAEPSVAELKAEIARLKQALSERGAPAADSGNASSPAAAIEAAPPAAGAAASAPADAQQLDTVVVRSRNRLERVQDVPVSISVIGGKELSRELALGIGAISQRAANVSRNVGNSRTFSMSIRGVGKVTQTEAQDTSVGFLVDGINYAYAPLASMNFYDLDSVEVLRGPQGTLQGKNATVGIIALKTRDPSFTPDANWSLTFGQHSTIISEVAGGGPVIDDLLAWRGALSVQKGAGPFHNRYDTDQTYFNSDRVSGRVKFLLTPNPDFSALASIDVQPMGGEYYNSGTVQRPVPARDATGALTAGSTNDYVSRLSRAWFTNAYGGQNYAVSGNYYGNPNPNTDAQQPLLTYTNGSSLQLKYNLGDHELTSITGYRDYHFNARNDDTTPFNITVNSGGKVDLYKQFSQELRIASKPGGFVDYQAGLLYFQNRVDFGMGGGNTGYGSDAGAFYANDSQYTDASKVGGSGLLLLSDSLNGFNKALTQTIKNKSIAIYGQANWHITDPLTVTTGLRLTHEDRTNSSSAYIYRDGFGALLNPTSVVNGAGGVVTFNTGFDSDGSTGALTTNNTNAQKHFADLVAQKYFGKTITGTPGDAYNSLDADQRKAVAIAKAVRAVTALGGALTKTSPKVPNGVATLYQYTDGPTYRKNQPGAVVSPSYKLDEDKTAYASLQYAEKGGVSQVLANGVPYLAAPEKAVSRELGLKSAWLDKTLFVNADVFHSVIRNYQQVQTYIDPSGNSNNNATYTGNAEKVQVKGLELDGSYTGIKNLNIRYAGALTSAKYISFLHGALPVEKLPSGASEYDQSGQQLPGASRYSWNIGAEYRKPFAETAVFHTSFNTSYRSSTNSDGNLSTYAWLPSQHTTDASIGLGRADQKFDVSLIVKNLFNDDTPQSITWTSYVPAIPRWFGVQFSGKL